MVRLLGVSGLGRRGTLRTSKTEHDYYIVTSSSSAALVALAQRGKRPLEQKFHRVMRSLNGKCENRFTRSRVMQDYLKPVLDLHAFLQELRWSLWSLEMLSC